ncbi:hypothetical protein BH24ACT26_BH24ACT26_22960 [soil metagenome]
MCRAEQPHLNQLAEEYEGRVTFIGVSNNDTVPDGEDYVEELDVPYMMAHAPAVWESYEVAYQPVTVVIDEDGTVATRIEGPVTLEGLRKIVEQVA